MDWTTLLTSAGVSVASVVAATKFFAKGMFENYLQKEIEKLRQQNALDIEKIKVHLNAELDRSTRFHTYEYNIYPELWGNLTETYTKILFLNQPKRYSPVPVRDNFALDEFLDKCRFSVAEKTEVEMSSQKQATYIEIRRKKELEDAKEAHNKFQAQLSKNCIFFPDPFSKMLTNVSNYMHAYINDTEERMINGPIVTFERYNYFKSGIKEMMEEIEAYIRTHISPTTSTI